MLMWVAGIIGGLGLICLISRRSLLGTLIGVQLLVLGSTMVFVFAGLSPAVGNEAAGARLEGHIAGLFVALLGVAQLVAGYALAIRLFYLKNKIDIHELRSLKQ
jgi:NADH:ubiquinone oxidoreductase subunit K